jgi:toxin ParE1/3/4
VKLVLRPLFLSDVTECADYLTTEAGEPVAVAWYESLQTAVQHILKTPKIGRLRPDLPVAEIRTLNLRKYPKYLVFYRLEENRIELLRVRHGMMNLTDLFAEPPPTQ